MRMPSQPGAGRARTYTDICSVGTQPVEPIMSVAGGMASTEKSSERAIGLPAVGEAGPPAQLRRASSGGGEAVKGSVSGLSLRSSTSMIPT